VVVKERVLGIKTSGSTPALTRRSARRPATEPKSSPWDGVNFTFALTEGEMTVSDLLVVFHKFDVELFGLAGPERFSNSSQWSTNHAWAAVAEPQRLWRNRRQWREGGRH